MGRRTQVVLAVLLASIMAFGLYLLTPSESKYRGHSVSWWLEDLHEAVGSHNADEKERAVNAIRGAGTNALPVLLHILRVHDSPAKTLFMRLAGKRILSRLHVLSANQSRFEAALGYEVLGPAASSQVPALVDALQNDSLPNVRHYAAEVLGMIGPPAEPATSALIVTAKDRDALLRLSSLGALNRIHPNPELAIPAFMAALDDPDQSLTRELAANALGSYGPQAKAAVPILLRTLATNAAAGAALKKIDPETAADAGIR